MTTRTRRHLTIALGCLALTLTASTASAHGVTLKVQCAELEPCVRLNDLARKDRDGRGLLQGSTLVESARASLAEYDPPK